MCGIEIHSTCPVGSCHAMPSSPSPATWIWVSTYFKHEIRATETRAAEASDEVESLSDGFVPRSAASRMRDMNPASSVRRKGKYQVLWASLTNGLARVGGMDALPPMKSP